MTNLILKIAILTRFRRQADCAEALKINETILSKIVQGRRAPTLEQRQILSQTLGINQDELFPQN